VAAEVCDVEAAAEPDGVANRPTVAKMVDADKSEREHSRRRLRKSAVNPPRRAKARAFWSQCTWGSLHRRGGGARRTHAGSALGGEVNSVRSKLLPLCRNNHRGHSMFTQATPGPSPKSKRRSVPRRGNWDDSLAERIGRNSSSDHGSLLRRRPSERMNFDCLVRSEHGSSNEHTDPPT